MATLDPMSNMGNIIGVCIFALGITLLIFGFNAWDGGLAHFVSFSPAGRPLWLIIGGALSVVAGLVLAYRGARETE